MSEPQAPRRARHLLDPDDPRPPASDRQPRMGIETVQRYVMSVLAATTILHLAIGLVIAGLVIEDEHRTSQIGLCVLGGAFGVISVAAALAIHGRSILSPWLLLGTVPGIVGVWLVLA